MVRCEATTNMSLVQLLPLLVYSSKHLDGVAGQGLERWVSLMPRETITVNIYTLPGMVAPTLLLTKLELGKSVALQPLACTKSIWLWPRHYHDHREVGYLDYRSRQGEIGQGRNKILPGMQRFFWAELACVGVRSPGVLFWKKWIGAMHEFWTSQDERGSFASHHQNYRCIPAPRRTWGAPRWT